MQPQCKRNGSGPVVPRRPERTRARAPAPSATDRCSVSFSHTAACITSTPPLLPLARAARRVACRDHRAVRRDAPHARDDGGRRRAREVTRGDKKAIWREEGGASSAFSVGAHIVPMRLSREMIPEPPQPPTRPCKGTGGVRFVGLGRLLLLPIVVVSSVFRRGVLLLAASLSPSSTLRRLVLRRFRRLVVVSFLPSFVVARASVVAAPSSPRWCRRNRRPPGGRR